MKRRTVLACLLVASLSACGGGESEAEERAETRAIMGEIFGAMRLLLPASNDPERFSDPANRDELLAAFGALTRQTDALGAHVAGQDLRFSYLARNVAGDAANARRAFEKARYERSAFLLSQITENCIVCHSRLPSPGDSPLAEEFMTPEALVDIALERRSALLIATRRFDSALATLEEIFASEESPALMLGPLTDYLTVSIRVKAEFERPARTLRRFLQREDLWRQLRADVETWIVSLGEVGPLLRGAPTLEGGRQLFDRGVAQDLLPGARAGQVSLIAASALLERYCIKQTAESPQLAEAYFLLGVIEARIGRNYWISEAPYFLETAIRMAPNEPFARDAFALLERELLLVFEGADEEEIPAADRRRLAELEALLESS